MEPIRFSEPLFEKYTIDKTYTIKRTNADGSTTIIDDPIEKERLLDSDYFKGSITFSRDVRHYTWIHKIIFLFQKIQSWMTGRAYKTDADVCHGAIILGKGRQKENKPHPFLVAHALTNGVVTSNWDALQDKDVTEILIYRPVDEKMREIYRKNAVRTAFVPVKEFRTAESPLKKHNVTLWDMFSTIFHNRPHSVCSKHGPICKRMKKRTAAIVADCLLGNQPLNDKEKPESFFCASYLSTMLQGSLFMRALDEGISEGQKKHFLNDDKNYPLKRCHLIKKIQHALEKEDKDDVVAKRLWEVYSRSKLARFDTKYTMSAYTVKKLDKLSVRAKAELVFPSIA
jgi:hypothetical protein